MKITVNNLKKLVKRMVRPDENSGKEKDTFEAALKRARDEAKYNLTEELREKYADFLDSPIKEKCILYEAFGGRGMTCSPHAIFKYLLTQTEFQEYLHVWVIDDFSDNEPWMGLYRDDPNVKFIKFQSVEYREYLATAKYLINNVSFPGYFTKRKEQIFVDTWHGIPLKTIGFDIPAGKVSAGNTVRNFLAADYLIAPNHFMTEIYENAFKMKNLYPGKILEIGQPRNDSYFHTDREAIFKKLQMAGVEADPKKKLILYAPTWKGSRYSSPDTSLDAYEKMIRTIEENVDTREYQVLVKPHQIVYYHIKDTVGITGQYIPATVDTNELLRATDVLISDYSSIYFDYLVSKKPILFFIPDLAEYKNYRGLYFGIDKLPGPVAETYEQLGAYVKDAERAMEPYRKVYEREAAWACPQDDGEVCRRLADIVFHGKEDSRCIACQDEAQSPKKKLLMYAGDFSEGDDTEAFLGLAENLDFQKYDVTLLVCGGGDDFAEEQIIGLPTGLRILYRGQPFNGKAEEIAKNELFLKGKIKDIPHAFYKREARRLFGEAKFDCAIDLTGKKSLFSVVAKEMDGVRFFQYNARFVREKQIAKELAGQQVIVSATESYFIARYQGSNPAVITVEAIPAPDTEKINYICMYQQKAQNVLKAFCRLEKNTCLYITGKGKGYQKLKAMVSELHLEGRVILTGWLEKPFAFMNLCDYFICPEGEEESLGTLAAKTMNMKLLAEDCTTEMPYSFQARSWNQEQCEKLDELIEGKRTSDE